MKKIEIINMVSDINEQVVNILEKIDDENEFKSFIENFYSEVGRDSDNFASVMSYYHGGKRIEDFISGVNYYMNTMNVYEITCEQVKEDLKVMKKLLKELSFNYSNLHKFCSYTDDDIKDAIETVMMIRKKLENDDRLSLGENKIYFVICYDEGVFEKYDFKAGHPILIKNLRKNLEKDCNYVKVYNLINSLKNVMERNNKTEFKDLETLIYAISELNNYCRSGRGNYNYFS